MCGRLCGGSVIYLFSLGFFGGRVVGNCGLQKRAPATIGDPVMKTKTLFSGWHLLSEVAIERNDVTRLKRQKYDGT